GGTPYPPGARDRRGTAGRGAGTAGGAPGGGGGPDPPPGTPPARGGRRGGTLRAAGLPPGRPDTRGPTWGAAARCRTAGEVGAGGQKGGAHGAAPGARRASTRASKARGEPLRVSFAVGTHPIDQVAATMRLPGDELGLISSLRAAPLPVVKCVTNDIRVPADS